MDFEFTSSVIKKLSAGERIAKYRQLAQQAEHRGEIAIARQWAQLAAEAEQTEVNAGGLHCTGADFVGIRNEA